MRPVELDAGGVVLRGVLHPRRRRVSPRATAVLLPGTGDTAATWDAVGPVLSADRDVVALSLRGHGRSDRPGAYSIAGMADDVAAALVELEHGPVDLVGHSLGGLVAMLVAAREPALVRRLVLEDVGLPQPRVPSLPARPDGALPFDWAVVEQVRPEIDQPAGHWPYTARAVAAPTLVVAGGPTSSVPQDGIADLVAAVPDARAVTVDAGHLVHEREPEQFTAHVLAFLAS